MVKHLKTRYLPRNGINCTIIHPKWFDINILMFSDLHVFYSFTGKKKRSKDHNSSFRSGGTWPRTRGGPIIEQGTGTILHPQKMKKERLPLAELLNNLPKYPPEGAAGESGLSKNMCKISLLRYQL